MKPIGAIGLLVAGAFAANAILVNPLAASADGLDNLRNGQGSIQSRIDQLAGPQSQPQVGQQPGEPAGAAASTPGSFPRSFLIPGTDTSIRIGGSVDGTASYYGH
jgi:hypothetical protein